MNTEVTSCNENDKLTLIEPFVDTNLWLRAFVMPRIGADVVGYSISDELF